MNCLLIGYMHGQGGIQSHTHFLATGLTEHGHSVLVLTPEPFAGHESVDHTGRAYTLQTYKGIRDIASARMENGPIDVAIVCGTGWAAMVGVRLNRSVRKRVFFEVMSGERIGKLDPRSIVHTGFDAIVGQAKPVEACFKKAFNWSGPSITIPALPEPLERAITIPERKQSDLNHVGALRLAYFGRLAPHKGVDILVKNWGMLSEFGASLDIWGTGEQQEYLSQYIQDKGLSDKIKLRGRYPEKADYIALLQSYDLKLLPTIGAEGAPLVLLEAMACGLPFIANGVGGIPDYDNPDVRITSGNIEEFFPLLRDWAGQHEKRNVDPLRLQRHYQNMYAFEVLVDRWERFLTALVAEKSLPAPNGS